MSLPTIDAAKAAIAPYTLAIKIAAGVVLLIAAAVLWWRVGVWHDSHRALGREVAKREAAEANLAAEIACEQGTRCAQRADENARAGADAVRKATEAAQEAARAEQARVAAEGQAAVERAAAAASEARVRLRDAEARLRKAMATDASCAAQAAEVIKCAY
jgi:hypothetical protein